MAPYFLRNLIPRREKTEHARPLLAVLASLTWLQWAQFFSGWLAWTCDAIDFFSVSLSVKGLGTTFGRDTHDITTAITLTLLLRSAGAVIFGIISDRYGRKWPLVVNLLIVAVLELGAGFVQTYQQFLGVRSLFGIGMGGIWGLAASTALENLPVEARGLASGVLQQGYAVGYLIAAVIELTLVPDKTEALNGDGWRSLFWLASGISLFAAILRSFLPESEVFIRAKAEARAKGQGADTSSKTRIFIRETGKMLKQHWLLCIYAVLLMTGFNFLSHGSQDLYPVYLTDTKGFSQHQATVATIIGNCGAIAGGAIAGWASQYIGRRLTIIICILLVAAFIPLWIIPDDFSGLAAGAFCIQFGVQGAWGVIPIQLAEMSPPAFRATFPGVAYQLGNMVSSASAQIEATGGDNLKTTRIGADGQPEPIPDYATVQGILIGVVAAYLLIVTVLGPENHGSHFEKHRAAFEEGGGEDDAYIQEDGTNAGPSTMRARDEESGSAGSVDEKREDHGVEKA
ncbi:MFS general substrate transporter [Dendrothele bispora CBS 962.96]|uniref:MFS general substrate transporter n=2 Tax=Dendrothele bispora (strain CBS 962.96) TaxID=1314807 RepID=A0A4S8KT93_DENBC|nr:MFS general substrate transporter [Dendrothele bispora CBS 962.96]